MSFALFFDQTLETLNVTSMEFSEMCNISVSTVRRYRLGKRIPVPCSDCAERVVDAIVNLANKRGLQGFDRNTINGLIKQSYRTANGARLNTLHFGMLLEVFEIQIKDLAESLNYDLSYIYKIRSGNRNPADIYGFVENLSAYIESHLTTTEEEIKLREMIGINRNTPACAEGIETNLIRFLIKNHSYENHTDALVIDIDRIDLYDTLSA